MLNRILFGFLIVFASGLFAQENKLDQLDKQSEEFFNAITGLEKTYLKEQIKKRKESIQTNLDEGNDVLINGNVQKIKKISEDEIKRELLEKENDKTRLSSDIARSKNIKDISIKSMYKFNGKNYVVLTQKVDEQNTVSTALNNESTLNIEGRYKKGDLILNHRIVYINTRTKTVTLYKKVDSQYGYFIYLNNKAVTVSDLKKIVKNKSESKPKLVSVTNKTEKKEDFTSNDIENTNSDECIYKLKVSQLNVRDNKELDGTILRILRKNDKVVGQKYDDTLLISKIYKYKSGDIMNVENQDNWILLSKEIFNPNKENCF